MSSLSNLYRRGKVIDHYLIDRPLSHGPAGRTYLALDRDTGQQVVMKFPNDDEIGGAEIYRRYLLEISLSTSLRHPMLVPALNPAESRSTNYLVLQYIPGRSLREIITTAPLSTTDALAIFIPLCEVLAYIHSQGIIHCDIKPENLLLSSGQVKLIDFGIAQLTNARSSTSTPVGTPDYMAPERLLGKKITPLADIYSFGIMFYEVLSGRLPFKEQDGTSLFGPQVSYDPPDILSFSPDLSPALATVVMRCIRRDPSLRYPNCTALLSDLQHLDTVIARPYVPEAPSYLDASWQILRVVLIIIVIFIIIVTLGYLAQLTHNAHP